MDAPLIKQQFTSLPEELFMSAAHIINESRVGMKAAACSLTHEAVGGQTQPLVSPPPLYLCLRGIRHQRASSLLSVAAFRHLSLLHSSS